MILQNEVSRVQASQYDQMTFWWDWQIPVYLFLGGLVAGMMILISLNILFRKDRDRSRASRFITWLPSVFLSLGMFSLFLNLTNKWNIARFYTTFDIPAPSSWGAWILIGVYPVSLLIALIETRLDQLQKIRIFSVGRILINIRSSIKDKLNLNILAIFNLGFGIALGIYTGILLSNLAGRPLWNSALLGPLFLISGLSTGAAFTLFFKLNEEEKRWVHNLDLGFIIGEIIFLALFILSLTSGSEAAREGASFFAGGEYTIVFWTLVVISGLLVPLVAYIQEKVTGWKTGIIVPVMILFGGFMLRWVMVFAGQVSSW